MLAGTAVAVRDGDDPPVPPHQVAAAAPTTPTVPATPPAPVSPAAPASPAVPPAPPPAGPADARVTSPEAAAPTSRAGRPLRVSVPAVGLDAAVLATRPTRGEIDPPTDDEAYWIEDYGTVGPGSDNTAYITGHSATRGAAVFDPLFDRQRQQARVAPGDEVTVTTREGRSTYRVSRVERYPKGELADTDDVWRIAPGRLVLITCFQRPDGSPSRDNLVVYAELAGSAAA